MIGIRDRRVGMKLAAPIGGSVKRRHATVTRGVTLVARATKWTFLGVMVAVTIVPLLWLVVSAFKTTPELFKSPFGFPQNASFGNFAGAFRAAPLGSYFRNSVVISTASTVVAIAISILAAYALRHRFRLNGAVRSLLMVGLLVPFTAFMTPIFYLVYHLHLYNSVWGIALVYVGISMPVGFLIVKGYMDTIPYELLEAARVDGASFHGILRRVMLPLSWPGLATAAIFLTINAWNELLFANLLSSGPSSQTLQVGILTYITGYAVNYPQAFAATVIAMAPAIVVYAVLSDRISTSMTAGALK